ncbi:helix-turn-helix transcriptional regulator [Nocardiopsis sp. NPDC007018]|uniref:helix-turn-helix domain-containing protein n=1 Tax=Nocardiopsis sp. NPDC007018 TaxID=3155721 RepID=UPI0033CE19A4
MRRFLPDATRAEGAKRRLAALLRGSRLDSGLSGQQLADALGWSQSKISKIENGRTRPSVSDAERWLGACGGSTDLVDRARELTDAALVESRHWRVAHSEGLGQGQREVGLLEDRATEVLSFQPSLIPGLLQTAEYAKQVLTLSNLSGQKDIAAGVAARLRRQEVLYGDGRRFRFLVTEAALRWYPTTAKILPAQLDRLQAVSTLSAVELRVLPLNSAFGQRQNNGFLLYEIPDESTVIVETFTRELSIAEPDEVAQYRDVHETLTEHALSEEESRAFIRDLAASRLA